MVLKLLMAKHGLFGQHSIANSFNSYQPFFILSAGRSGSTLLRTILSRDESIVIPPESDDLIPQWCVYFLKNQNQSWTNLIDGMIQISRANSAMKYWEVDYDKLKKELLNISEQSRSLDQIISVTYRFWRNSKDCKWGDKTPYLLLQTDYLNQVFPKARYVFMIRDGRDVVASRIKAFKRENIEKAANRWINSLKEMERLISRIDQSNYIIIKYEDLVTNPNNTVSNVCEFLNISFTEELLNHDKQLDLGDTIMEHHANSNKAVSVKAIGNYVNTMKKDELLKLNSKISIYLKTYNYL